MNIIIKIFFGLFFIMSYKANGQTARIVDLKVNILSPLSGSWIKSPGTVLINFSIFNKGPDVLKPYDTIFFYPESNDTLFKTKRIFCSKILQVGDSEIFNITIPFNSPNDNNYYNLGISGVTAYNRSPDSLRRESLKWQKDNTKHITVKHRSATSAVNKFSLQNQFIIYPNPANDFFNLKIDEKSGIDQIELFTLNGKRVKKFQLNNFSQFKVLTDDLPNGVYFVKCSNNQTSYCSKLTIIH